jgi:hypothetical protein
MPPESVIGVLQPKKHLICLLVIAKTRWLKWLDEVDVEIALRLRRRPVVGGTEKQIATPLNAAILPLDLVLPYLVT